MYASSGTPAFTGQPEGTLTVVEILTVSGVRAGAANAAAGKSRPATRLSREERCIVLIFISRGKGRDRHQKWKVVERARRDVGYLTNICTLLYCVPARSTSSRSPNRGFHSACRSLRRLCCLRCPECDLGVLKRGNSVFHTQIPLPVCTTYMKICMALQPDLPRARTQIGAVQGWCQTQACVRLTA